MSPLPFEVHRQLGLDLTRYKRRPLTLINNSKSSVKWRPRLFLWCGGQNFHLRKDLRYHLVTSGVIMTNQSSRHLMIGIPLTFTRSHLHLEGALISLSLDLDKDVLILFDVSASPTHQSSRLHHGIIPPIATIPRRHAQHCPHRSFAQPSPEVRSESEVCQRQLSRDSPSMTLRLWQPNHDSPFMAIVYDMGIINTIIGSNTPRNEKRVLTSWKSETDPSPEDFVSEITLQSPLSRPFYEKPRHRIWYIRTFWFVYEVPYSNVPMISSLLKKTNILRSQRLLRESKRQRRF
ncbi:hypothetical protein YC2023_115081 [Brassica napus]